MPFFCSLILSSWHIILSQIKAYGKLEVTFHTHTNHWLIGVENENKSGPESAPPLKAVFKRADSVTFTGLPVNSNS